MANKNKETPKAKVAKVKKTQSKAPSVSVRPQIKAERDNIKNGPALDPLVMQQADGKIYNKYGVRSIDELLGISSNKYNTHDVDKYEAQLNEMNTSDLQAHSISLGVLPKEDRRLLVQLLLKQFRIANSAHLNPAQEAPGITKKITKETLRILAEGK